MSKPTSVLVAAAFTALLPLSAWAEGVQPVFRMTMMDMMPMGGGAMPGMGDNKMPPGGGMPAQAQQQMPPGGGGAMPGMGGDKMPAGAGMPVPGQTPPGAGCGMMEMMQNMMRMGTAPPGMAPTPGAAMAGGMQQGGSSAARLEGRIAFLRTELRITDAQAPAWEAFAIALRAGREHLDAARTALQDSNANPDAMARMKSFESHLRERAEAIHTTQMAFIALNAQLNDAQKQQAAATMLPFIGAF